MDIGMITKILKKELGVDIKPDYYEKINLWAQWWKGHVDSFHKYHEIDAKGNKIERELFSLKMAKKICEDWASSLLNEKTKVTLEDKASSVFLQGEENEKGGVFPRSIFGVKQTALWKKAFTAGRARLL